MKDSITNRGFGIDAPWPFQQRSARLLNTENVVVNRPAVDAGLAVLDAGGDFADGSIAYAGSWLGGETFVSFDRKAIKLLCALGQSSRLLSKKVRLPQTQGEALGEPLIQPYSF